MDRVKAEASVTLLLLVAAGATLTLSAPGTTDAANPDGYSHAAATCLQGSDGTGLRLRLRQRHHCDGSDTYPYLEIDVREQAIAVNKSLAIGDTNSAFRCQSSKKSCKPFVSGEIMFNHLEESSPQGLQTDGWYELKFSTGLPETGRFKVDCFQPCG